MQTKTRPAEIPPETIIDWLKVDLVVTQQTVWRNLFLWHWARRVSTIVLGVLRSSNCRLFFVYDKIKLTSDTLKNFNNPAWLFAIKIVNSRARSRLQHFESQVFVDIHLTVVQENSSLSRFVWLKDVCWLVLLGLCQFSDSGNVIFSSRRLWPTGTSQLS